ncbi:MAG: PHP domain-containing protein [Saprospiraceae bacterium]|nr:PHP domain-containing protein [Saprospiraceae bacterium]
MTNKEVAAAFQLLAKLMELYGENQFKIRSYQRAYAYLGKMGTPLIEMTEAEIGALPGVGKAITGKIGELLTSGKMNTLERFKEKTPPGIQELIMVKGLGVKKIKTAWETLGVESATELLYACTENRLVELKGFGPKTQKEIRKQLEFFLQNRSKFIHLKVQPEAEAFLLELRNALPDRRVELTGAIRRCQPIVCKIEYLIQGPSLPDLQPFQDRFQITAQSEELLEGKLDDRLPVTLYLAPVGSFIKQWIRTTGPKELEQKLTVDNPASEEDAFIASNLPYLTPESRDLVKTEADFPVNLVTRDHIRGVIHNHSTYSDGVDSIAEMSLYCQSKGFKYLGITDHSQIAVYANGLYEEDLNKQWAEIDQLNKKNADFKILKGIECDILSDGGLDYEERILEQFDFIIASVHTNIKMDKQKATERVIRAVENPYTNILGHPTGRLLLGREGYPIDMQAVIDACAANQVAIELNASPYRLDLDWQWIPYAMEKGVMISINPDAHAKEAIDYIDFGVKIARKGWLSVDSCLNARDVNEFLEFCQK